MSDNPQEPHWDYERQQWATTAPDGSPVVFNQQTQQWEPPAQQTQQFQQADSTQQLHQAEQPQQADSTQQLHQAEPAQQTQQFQPHGQAGQAEQDQHGQEPAASRRSPAKAIVGVIAALVLGAALGAGGVLIAKRGQPSQEEMDDAVAAVGHERDAAEDEQADVEEQLSATQSELDDRDSEVADLQDQVGDLEEELSEAGDDDGGNDQVYLQLGWDELEDDEQEQLCSVWGDGGEDDFVDGYAEETGLDIDAEVVRDFFADKCD